MERLPSNTGLNMPDTLFNNKMKARGGKRPSKLTLGLYRQEDVADMLTYTLAIHQGDARWKCSATPIKEHIKYGRGEFARMYDVQARNDGDAGITFIYHLYSAKYSTVHHIAVDSALKTEGHTKAVHDTIQIKPPKAPGSNFTSVQMALDLSEDHYYFQVYASTVVTGHTANVFYFIRLIPMWILPPEAFNVMMYEADPTQVMADVSHVGKILGPDYLKWACFKPGIRGIYKPVWDYLPERIDKLEGIRSVYNRPGNV